MTTQEALLPTPLPAPRPATTNGIVAIQFPPQGNWPDLPTADVQTPSPDTRALVLAGAGAAGNAWQLGLIAGLAEAGLDVTTADVIIGTSAGSTVAAQITSGTRPAELYAAILAEVPRPPRESPPGRRPTVSGPDYLQWSDRIIAAATDATDLRRSIGAAALELDAPGDGSNATRWRDIVAARLPNHEWPAQRVLIPAIDARTGDPVVFNRDSGIELVDAVAASTSALTPYRIGENHYLNGGYRRSSNGLPAEAALESLLASWEHFQKSVTNRLWTRFALTRRPGKVTIQVSGRARLGVG